MKNGKGIDLGVVLISTGIIWALISANIISWSIINSLWLLWPLILIVIGVGIIFGNNVIVRNAAWIIFLAILIAHSYFYTGDIGNRNNSDSSVEGTIPIESILNGDKETTGEVEDNLDEVKDVSGDLKTVSEDKKAGIEKAQLRLAMGACRIIIDSDTEKMLEATLENDSISYKNNDSGDSAEFAFEMKNVIVDEKYIISKNLTNSFHLNKEVPWELKLEIGAVDGSFDLGELAVEKLSLDVGAANVDLKLGDKVEKCKVVINSGVSKINIEVPASAGVKVEMDGALNSSDLDGPQWEKKGDTYFTKNYESSGTKIDIEIDMGLGNLNFDFK